MSWLLEKWSQLRRRLSFSNSRLLQSGTRTQSKSLPSEEVLVGFPKHLVNNHPWIKNHLSRLPHLGLLEVPQGIAPRSRWDYCLEQCRQLGIIKETKPGLGLSNTGKKLSDEGSIKKMTALEVMQTWVILTNLGHLFGTFATERALMFSVIHSNPELCRELLDSIPPELRDSAEGIVRSQAMYQFYSVVAYWRIGQDSYSDEERAQCLGCLKLLSSPRVDSKILTLQSIFRFVRRLSYLKMHVELGVTSLLDKHLFSDEVIEHVIEHEELHYDSEVQKETPTERLLKAIDEYQYETYFAGEQTASVVLEHLREFKQWWSRQEEEGVHLKDRIKALYQRPSDWPALETPQKLNFFVRLELPRQKAGLVSSIVHWWGGGDPWGVSNFYISQSPASPHLFIDVFIAKSMKPKTAAHIAQCLIQEQARDGLESLEKLTLERSISRFAISLLGEILQDNYRLRLRRVMSKDGSPMLAMLSNFSSVEDLCHKFISLGATIDDQQRLDEIKGMHEYLQATLSKQELRPDALFFAFLGSTFLIEEGSGGEGKFAGKRKMFKEQEVDGIIAILSRTEITWHVLEVKRRKKNHPTTQMAKISNFFAHSGTSIDTISRNGYEVASFQQVWKG